MKLLLKLVHKVIFLLTPVVVLLVNPAISQQDTVFWFAAPDVSSSQGQTPISLNFLSYDNAATVTITQPANGGFTPIVVNLAANSSSSVDLSTLVASIESPAADVASNNGLHISSTAEVTAYYEIGNAGNKEIFSLKGSRALGTNFYTPFQTHWDNAVVSPATFSSIEIVATEDNTTILITPKTAIVGHASGATYSVLLQEGETYSARDVNVTAISSLAGSIVASDKPVAVTLFSGALSNVGCTSSMGDQITPTDYIGEDYIIRRGNATGDRAYVLATQNGTSLTISNSGTTSTLINWGETYEIPLSDTVNYISSNKPIYVWHASGYGCNLAGSQVPNLFCAGKYTQAFSRSSTDSLGVLLYTRSGFESMFTVNGSAGIISASDFDPVPGTSGGFVAALVYLSTTDAPVGTYNTISNSGDVFGLAVLHGSSSTGSAYAYLSEFSSYPFVNAGLADTICANATLSLNGIVGGGSVTGVWGSNGFGSFNNSLNDLSNTYIPSNLDTIISPINIILTSTGPCPVTKDTLVLTVTPAPLVNASADQSVCANNANVQLGGTVLGGANSGQWTTLGSGVFVPNDSTLDAVYIPSTADITAGTATLVLTSTNSTSCQHETDTMVVFITPAPVALAAQDTIIVCSNNPVVSVSGSITGPTTTGKWTTSGNGVFAPNNLSMNPTYTPSPNDIAAGSINLYLESTGNGNCVPEVDTVVVIFTQSPQVDAGTNIITCTNDPLFDLNATISGPTTTGVWTGGLGTFTPNDSTLTASYLADPSEIIAGSITLTLTSTNNGNCLAVADQIQISFVSPPFANFGFTNECDGDSTQFTDLSLNGFGNVNTWDWDFDDGNFSSDENPTHLFPGPGSYDVELVATSDVGCSDTMVKTVDVYDVPVAAFGYDAECVNNQIVVNFYDSSTVANDTINFWYYDFGGQGSQATPNPTQLFLASGSFIITQIVNSTQNCADTNIQTINLTPKPEAGFYYNTNNGLNVGAQFTFIDTSDYAVAWDWDLGNGNTSNLQDPSTVYFSNGSYVVTQYVYNDLGCSDSARRTIDISTVTTRIEQLIPNAISPNGDGKNDVWKLNFLPFTNPNAEVTIFNRWGQTLFHSIGYFEPWDGTYKGEMLPEGTYYYVIKLHEDETYTGSILLLTARKN